MQTCNKLVGCALAELNHGSCRKHGTYSEERLSCAIDILVEFSCGIQYCKAL
jgi:hypothetical protein